MIGTIAKIGAVPHRLAEDKRGLHDDAIHDQFNQPVTVGEAESVDALQMNGQMVGAPADIQHDGVARQVEPHANSGDLHRRRRPARWRVNPQPRLE